MSIFKPQQPVRTSQKRSVHPFSIFILLVLLGVLVALGLHWMKHRRLATLVPQPEIYYETNLPFSYSVVVIGGFHYIAIKQPDGGWNLCPMK